MIMLHQLKWLMAICFSLALPYPCVAQIHETINALVEKRRHARCFRMTLESTVTLFRHEQGFPQYTTLPSDLSFDVYMTFYFDPQRGYYRVERRGQEWDPSLKQLVPDEGVIVYANNEFRVARFPATGKSDAGRGSLKKDFSIMKDRFDANLITDPWLPILFSCGYVPLSVTHVFYPSQFHQYNVEDYTDCLVNLNRPGSPPNTWCFGTPEFKSFHGRAKIDIYSSAINHGNISRYHAYTLLDNNTVRDDYDLTVNYAATGFASNWSHMQYIGGKKARQERCKVTSWQEITNPTSIDYRLEPTEGMVVAVFDKPTKTSDQPVNQLIFYRAGDNGTLLPLEGVERAERPARWSRFVGFVILVAIALVTSIYLWRRCLRRNTHKGEM